MCLLGRNATLRCFVQMQKCVNTVFLPVQKFVKWPFDKMSSSINFFVDLCVFIYF